ncbi:MAG: hypothetical protein AAFP76_11870 [Bacteroidota bacterium]
MNQKIMLLLVCSFLWQACCWNGDCPDDDTVVEPNFESAYTPVYMGRSSFEESIVLDAPKNIIEAGKIYVFQDLMFVNEVNDGFHVFLNSDPENPQPISFINTPGATDVSIKDGIYYINQAVDLIAIEFNARSSELNVTKRIRNIFPVMISPDGFYPIEATENNIVVDWIPKN